MPVIFKQLVRVFQLVANTGRGSNYCLKMGFLPLRVHYYSPVPDIHDLKNRNVWEIRSELKGIDFRVEKQIELIQIIIPSINIIVGIPYSSFKF